MPRMPKYQRKVKDDRYAFCRIGGREYHLGHYDSAASREKFNRLVSGWTAAGCPQPWRGPGEGESAVGRASVVHIADAFIDHAISYYRKGGKPTGEVGNIKRAMVFLVELHGSTRVDDFGVAAFNAVRDSMVADGGLARNTVNRYAQLIKRAFRWAAENEMCPADVNARLSVVRALAAGRTTARETEKVRPVPHDDVVAVQADVHPQLAAMIEVQLWAGLRPGELVSMRPMDLSPIRGKKGMKLYRPESHKTEHHGKSRAIVLGPKAWAALKPYAKGATADEPIFDPRKAPHAAKGGRRPARSAYDRTSYEHAIRRSCVRLKIKPPWSPNQLRHNAATRLAKLHGAEIAKVILGHSSAVTSETYIERDIKAAIDIMGLMG